MRTERTPGPPEGAPSARRRRRVALAVLACACAFVVQSPGWAQTSYMALSRALSHGTAKIDRWHWETHDVAYTNGHYYSVKPPGLVLATLPLYLALDAVGAQRIAHDARVRAESDGGAPWAARRLPVAQYGHSERRAIAAREAIADDAPLTWVLGLLGVLAPAVALLVLVARCADRLAGGTGTAVALTLGSATLVLPFATLYFSHMLSALLGFAAFALVWRERERGAPLRPAPLALAGALAGLAVLCEYPLAIVAAIVGLYALMPRAPGAVRRTLAYGSGLAAGVTPLLAYQWWAFGSPLHTTYENAVAWTGRSGHDEIGLNDGGFFGITLPRPEAALELLFSGRGLLTLTPVLVVAIAGAIALCRDRRHRAEANVIIAVALAYLVYNAGYWLPLGGGSPGPRFLFPILPFLALGLALAWRRWPAVTLALTAISATTMTVATMSYPMIGINDPGTWVRRMFELGLFQHSVLDLAGIAHGAMAVAPFAVGVAVALALGVSSLPRAQLARGARWAPLAVAAWALCAIVLPPAPMPTEAATYLIAAAALIGLLAVALVALPRRRRLVRSAQDEEHHAAAPRALEVQPAQRPG
ncbi:MAG TPA: hypothetical protein VG474_00800 [Solirubrobacteraceae bacterium]|nr:hypothetical protein [Solirubrobacteraceae bacterium]